MPREATRAFASALAKERAATRGSRSTGFATRINVDVRFDLPLDRKGSDLAADAVDGEDHRLSCPSRVDPDVAAAMVRRFVRAPHESDVGVVAKVLPDGARY